MVIPFYFLLCHHKARLSCLLFSVLPLPSKQVVLSFSTSASFLSGSLTPWAICRVKLLAWYSLLFLFHSCFFFVVVFVFFFTIYQNGLSWCHSSLISDIPFPKPEKQICFEHQILILSYLLSRCHFPSAFESIWFLEPAFSRNWPLMFLSYTFIFELMASLHSIFLLINPRRWYIPI